MTAYPHKMIDLPCYNQITSRLSRQIHEQILHTPF